METRFYSKRLPVGIVGLWDDYDAFWVRSLLESMGATTHLYLPGTPGDFLQIIGMESDVPPYLLICGHGKDDGIIFGEYIAEMDTSMLKNESLPPEQVAQHIRLPGCVVLGLFCGSGEPAMAQAFMRGGLKAYIGMVAPDADFLTVPMFITQFFYHLLRHQSSEKEAWEKAAAYDKPSRVFVFYDAEGAHRV
jgi:hypothetical protein